MSNLLHGPISTNQILPREKHITRDIFGMTLIKMKSIMTTTTTTPRLETCMIAGLPSIEPFTTARMWQIKERTRWEEFLFFFLREKKSKMELEGMFQKPLFC